MLYQYLRLRNTQLYLKHKLSPSYFKTSGRRCLAFPPLHCNEPLHIDHPATGLHWKIASKLPQYHHTWHDTNSEGSAIPTNSRNGALPDLLGALPSLVEIPALPRTTRHPSVGWKWPHGATRTGCPLPLTLRKRSYLPFLGKQKVREHLHLNGKQLVVVTPGAAHN